ncbi:RNA polymerase sigma factor SigY [Clostridium pasteurianum]|uniref:RNA polymerase sigma factor, sigma-70 family n=1 Tax=Clostridium pasteurianum BC1 TaxID=86416 RepID=R4K198_CLOPA|nr:RNA polymerase sigma factor SigY [Clostridium pasteurianum]AGK96348.1 RNA polymerase sigma factor, sigma-70 family [Clostridium pasteurianum BC1]
MDELVLIEKAKQGNKSALNLLLTENYNLVKGYIIKMTGDPTLSQDILQETMLKAVLNIKKFSPKAKFSTWLITIATNLYRDNLRKDKHLAILDENMISDSGNPEDAAISKLEYVEILQVIKCLPYEKRAVFILKHFYNYSYEEISKILNCPVGTVRSRLHYSVKYIILELERRGMINE